MKLFKDTESPYLSRQELKKVCLATSIMVIVLYVVAIICSLNGSNIFIMNYQNSHMDSIEYFLKEHSIYPALMWLFTTVEFTIEMSFILGERPKIYFILAYFIVPVGLAFLLPTLPSIVYTLATVVYQIGVCLLTQLINYREIRGKLVLKQLLKIAIAQIVSLVLQLMIFIIKSGSFSMENHIMNLSATIIYAIEFEIALSVLLVTVALYIDKEKGDSEQWATYQAPSGSSQTSKTRSQRLSLTTLSKKQKNKLFWLYAKLYLIQVLGFAFIMIVPFLFGKVFEFLIMYFAFAIVRYILGFKYSLHFKNEILCITVGAVVFGILTLAVPFFYIDLIIAVLLGVGLAIFLHLSYKYKGFWLFAKMAKPDKFAALYVIFEGDLSEDRILRQCKYKGLCKLDSYIVLEYMNGEKVSYLAEKNNYSIKSIDRILTNAITQLNN